MRRELVISGGEVPSPASATTDERLVLASAKNGERRAFAAIYKRHHQALYRYCRSIVGNDQDAEDALQNTMVKILGSLPGESRELRLKPWLYRIAHNEAINVLRRRRPQAELEDADGCASPGADDHSANAERVRQLFADLEELPERQRGALLMRELSGLSCAEIARAFGTSTAAIKQSIYEARSNLMAVAEGRKMDCEAVRVSLSDGDRRVIGARRMRAHLKSCSGCREFRRSVDARRADLASAIPVMPAATSAALLGKLLGSGQFAAGGGGGMTALAGGAKTLAGSVLVKGAAVVLVAAGVGAGIEAVDGNATPLDHVARDAVVISPGPRGSEPGSATRESTPGIGRPLTHGAVHGRGNGSIGRPGRGPGGDGDSGQPQSNNPGPVPSSDPPHQATDAQEPAADGANGTLPAAASNGQEEAASHAPTLPAPAQDHPTAPPVQVPPVTPPSPPAPEAHVPPHPGGPPSVPPGRS